MKSIQVQDLPRLNKILAVLAKYGFGTLFSALGVIKNPPAASPEVESSGTARRLRLAAAELGTTWIKLAQVLSVRPDILPKDVIAEFQTLQDHVPPMAEADLQAVLLEELGGPIEQVFTHFDPEPLGSASIAQVHRAVLVDGREVAVKVQRRGIEAQIRSDLHIAYTLAGALDGRIKLPGVFSPTEIVQEFDQAIQRELDFTQELRAGAKMRKLFQDDPRVVVPAVHPRWSTRRVLVMDLVRGEPMNNRLGRHALATDEDRELAHTIMDLAYQQIFVHGFFHGDPHPGNLLVDDQNRLIMLDFGLTGTLTAAMQDTIITAFTSMVFRDAETLALTIYRAGGTSQRVDLRAFRNEIERLMTKYYGMSLDELADSPDNVLELVQTAARFHIALPSEFAVLARTFGLLEGTLRGLLPGIDIIEEVKPYANRLVTERFSPDRVALDVARGIVQAQGYLKELPTQLQQLLTDVEKGDVSFRAEVGGWHRLQDEIRLGATRISLALFASTVTIGALLFLAAWSPAPLGIPLFGLFGMVLAVLGLTLFGALGIHVFLTGLLDFGAWRRWLLGLVRFFSWRRRS